MKICRPYITVKGRVIYAKDVGKKAFCWEVTEEQHKEYLAKKAKEEKKKADKEAKAETEEDNSKADADN